MSLINSTLCRRCRAEEENSAHVSCECEAVVALRHSYLGSFCLNLEDVRSLSLGENLVKEQGSHDLDIRF